MVWATPGKNGGLSSVADRRRIHVDRKERCRRKPPDMSKRDVSLVEFVADQLATRGTITHRPMMGGWTLYCGGVVFALIARGELYLKGDAENRSEFEARGWPAFRPDETKPGTMSYFLVPPDVLDNAGELRRWAAEAVAAGKRSAKPKKKPAAPPPRRSKER